ncbi:MAG TPA: proline racemase family protein [Candidatus Dormibacteraeota bacterium]
MDTIRTVDYHTAGEPFRIVVGGVPPLEGATVPEQRRWAGRHLDHVRRLLVNEPRGHADMYGCFVTSSAAADLGVVFFHNEGYSTACGHGTIALVTWALESGRLPCGDGEVEVAVEVPSGCLRTWATVRGGDVTAVRFRNVPSFVLRREVEAAGCTVDVAFGGAFYAIAPAPAPVDRTGLAELVARGRAVRQALNRAGDVVHPLEPELRDVYGVMWTDGARNVTVFADGAVDRSPCGSGTSARLALLDATGELPRGHTLRHESVAGTAFEGRVVAGAVVAGIPAVVTEVTGTAHLTGRHEFVLEPDDPVGTGFLLR